MLIQSRWGGGGGGGDIGCGGWGGGVLMEVFGGLEGGNVFRQIEVLIGFEGQFRKVGVIGVFYYFQMY